MTHPDQALWKQSWRANRIDFHLPHVHPLLARYWPSLDLQPDDRVFVPLCGKSLDLMWLHGLGHDVTAVELSPIAVQAFFSESGQLARRNRHGAFTRWSQARLAIYCGDFFRLKASDLLGVRAVYDRASLTALPEDLRTRYVAHLAAILPADSQVLLLTVEDLDEGESAADASGASAEIEALYRPHFSITLLHAEAVQAVIEDGLEMEALCIHKAYALRLQRNAARVDA